MGVFRGMMGAMSVALVAAVALGQGGPAKPPQASGIEWKQTGWGGGGYYWAAAFHPTRDGVIYLAGDVNGVYKSEDHGKQFRIINKGLSDYGVYGLAVDPATPDTVYAATVSGLCKSIDAGETWKTIGQTPELRKALSGQRGKSVRSVAVDPADSRIVYVASPFGGIYKSTDGGENWQVAYPAGEGKAFHSVAVAAKEPAMVLAGTSDAGVLMSDDAGKTWRPLQTPKQAKGVAIYAGDPAIIYGAFAKDGVWKSTDKGQTWSKASEGIVSSFSAVEVAISPVNPQDVYVIGGAGWGGRFYRSQDGGSTWQESSRLTTDLEGNPTDPAAGRNRELSAPTNLAINPRNPAEMYISGNWRCVWSDDAGKTWVERERGADITCVHDIRFLDGKTYVAAMDEGTVVSDDHGASWRQVWPPKHSQEISGHNWRVAVNNINGAHRIISTCSPWDSNSNRILRSDDGGKVFEVIKAGLPDYYPKGNTMWEKGYARALAVDPKDPNIVYLGIDGNPEPGKMGGGLFKSTDGAKTWQQMPNQPPSRRMFYGLAVDPTDSNRLYWGTCGPNGGLYRSDDGGQNWTLAHKGVEWAFNVVVTADGTVYTPGKELHRSTDGGKTFTPITNFVGSADIVAMEAHPTDPKTFWFATTTWSGAPNGGVYKTSDGGQSWQEITGNLPYRKPLILRYNPQTKQLWAGGVGLYCLPQ